MRAIMSVPIGIADDTDAVAQAEHRLARAHLQLDLTAIEQLLHPDYLAIQPGAKVETKAEIIAFYGAGTRHWDTAEADQLDTRLYGDTAVVVGRWTASGQHGPERFDYAAGFLSICVKQDGQWRNTGYTSTEIESQ